MGINRDPQTNEIMYPYESTYIEVEIGMTPEGQPIVELRRIETAFHNYNHVDKFEELDEAERTTAVVVIQEIHAARCALESLPLRQCELAKEILLGMADEVVDLEDEASVIYRAIREAIRRTDGTTHRN